MAIEITMPKLSDTMQEGTILKWRVQQGAQVAQGDVIAEVETDKAAMEMEAFESGTVRELRVPEGETVSVGSVIAVLATNGEGKEAPERKAAPARPLGEEPARAVAEEAEAGGAEEGRAAVEKARNAEEKRKEQERREQEEAARREREDGERREAAPQEKVEKREEPAEAKPVLPRLRHEEIVASPAARRLAREKGLELSQVRGTGPGGRIVLADVEGAQPGRRAEKPVAPGRPEPRRKPEPEQRPERSVKIRRIVGRKMVESWQNIPHFFVTVAIDMTDIIRIRKDLRASINDFMIAAAARCLQEYPWVNSHWVEGEPVEQKEINIAMAIATDRGLYNPVIRDCGRLSLKEISRRAADLVDRAHAGRLRMEELEGGTFTISNMGMLGVESFTAIITPPQAAVLAVGTVRGEAVVDDRGEPGVAPMVRLTLSSDHRILDGADAAEFLAALKSYLEAPVTLITWDYGKEQ